MSIENNIQNLQNQLQSTSARLIAVTKTHPIETIQVAYTAGLREFGENRVQELVPKAEALPQDIRWHLIGTLQSNKVKYIAPFVYLIHSVDKPALLQEINKQAQKHNRLINCLLQIHIAQEETKFGFDYTEAEAYLKSKEIANLKNIQVLGLMGMATFTNNEAQIRQEFRGLKQFFDQMKAEIQQPNINFSELSMGMSSDWQIAVEEGSTMVRVGSAIFGARA
jgi:PLP dependent protein